MSLGPNIARNAALRENVFMIAICIELRIPLFLVGKPGSSKSLAKSIVQTSMQGTASNSELLRGFKQVSVDILYKVGQSWIAKKPNSSLGIINKAHVAMMTLLKILACLHFLWGQLESTGIR